METNTFKFEFSKEALVAFAVIDASEASSGDVDFYTLMENPEYAAANEALREERINVVNALNDLAYSVLPKPGDGGTIMLPALPGNKKGAEPSTQGELVPFDWFEDLFSCRKCISVQDYAVYIDLDGLSYVKIFDAKSSQAIPA